MERKLSLFGPLVLIAAGTLWLMISSGKIPSENLWALTHYWPFLLIGAGIGLILSPFWKYSPMVMDILIVGGAVLTIVFAPQLGWQNPSMFSIIQNGNFFIGLGEPGSGNILTETRKVGNFQSIKLDYPAQVVITQGSVESVKVEAEDNVLPGLKTQVQNDRLGIFYKVDDGRHVNPKKPVKITIVVKNLNTVDFTSAGDLTINGLTTDKLDISLSSAGNFKMSELNVKALSVNLSGAGSMTASGITDNLDVNISGFGSFNGKELHGKFAHVNLTGAGGAIVWVDGSLNVNISGAGSVNYYGSPTVNKQVSGVGGVNKSGDK